jgi:hypothetical protein
MLWGYSADRAKLRRRIDMCRTPPRDLPKVIWDITQNFKALDDFAMVGALSHVREKTDVHVTSKRSCGQIGRPNKTIICFHQMAKFLRAPRPTPAHRSSQKQPEQSWRQRKG